MGNHSYCNGFQRLVSSCGNMAHSYCLLNIYTLPHENPKTTLHNILILEEAGIRGTQRLGNLLVAIQLVRVRSWICTQVVLRPEVLLLHLRVACFTIK